MLQDADALPQLVGDYKPLDQWQTHLNQLFYGLRGDRLRSYYQTFASADFRLAHALAADYYECVMKREQNRSRQSSSSDRVTILELGPGNGNLAACFLSHLKTLDARGRSIHVCAMSWSIGNNQCWTGLWLTQTWCPIGIMWTFFAVR